MMTRKDYVETARILNTYIDEVPTNTMMKIVEEFIEMFQNDNANFDYEIFLKAVTK